MEKPKLIEDLGMRLPTPTSKQKKRYGIFECPYCNGTFEAIIYNVKIGYNKSCGCAKSFLNKIGSHRHGGIGTRIYSCYRHMIDRCYNPSYRDFRCYGGRDVPITVCDSWKESFIPFRDWALTHGYDDKLSLNRINTNGNYEPSNCNWAPLPEQMQNTTLLHKNNTTGYRGVSSVIYKKKVKWIVRIQAFGIKYTLKYFDTKEQAAQAYNDWIIEHGTFHPLNIIPKPNN